MEDLVAMIASGESPSDVSDQIKNMLSLKSIEKIDSLRPAVAAQMFDMPEIEMDYGDESYDGSELEQEEE